MSTGAFTRAFAEKKDWKLDPGLMAALTWLLDEHLDRDRHTIIDLGAGIGRYVRALREAGWKYTVGADAIPGIRELSGGAVMEADLTEPKLWDRVYSPDRGFAQGDRPHFALFVEVAEHIDRKYHGPLWDNVADSVRHHGLLVVSVAVPGQRGKGHVSCMLPEAVANKLGRRGCHLLESETAEARKRAGKGWDKKLLVLRRW